MGRSSTSIAVLGAGSWGTALAVQFARAGHPTILWGRADDQVAAMSAARCNERYLPGVEFPERLQVSTNLLESAEQSEDVLVVVPSEAFRTTLQKLKVLGLSRIAWATKGFELSSGLLPHQVAAEVLASTASVAVLSGPTFAKEVGMGLPSAMTIASRDPDYCQRLAENISTETFRAYTADDIVGVEVGGAVKNALAIGAGISDGLGFGANTRIALLNRGLAEMTRLGLALGAQAETFMGLSGMGDLVLTCTDNQSRNRRFGLALAAGKSIEEARQEIGQVVEGYFAAKAVYDVGRREGVEMPIIEQIYAIVHEGKDPQQAVVELMRRPITPE